MKLLVCLADINFEQSFDEAAAHPEQKAHSLFLGDFVHTIHSSSRALYPTIQAHNC